MPPKDCRALRMKFNLSSAAIDPQNATIFHDEAPGGGSPGNERLDLDIFKKMESPLSPKSSVSAVSVFWKTTDPATCLNNQ